MTRSPGRPTKLTPAIQAQIVDAIANGHYDVTAAAMAGIGRSTFYQWIARGEAEATDPINPDQHTKPELLELAADAGITPAKSWTKAQIADAINDQPNPYVEFADAVKEADAKAEAFAMSQMFTVGRDSWQMWMTYLERTRPDRWARRAPAEGVDEAFIGDEADAEQILERGRSIREAIRIAGTEPAQLERRAAD